jgi:hypothetical protein
MQRARIQRILQDFQQQPIGDQAPAPPQPPLPAVNTTAPPPSPLSPLTPPILPLPLQQIVSSSSNIDNEPSTGQVVIFVVDGSASTRQRWTRESCSSTGAAQHNNLQTISCRFIEM